MPKSRVIRSPIARHKRATKTSSGSQTPPLEEMIRTIYEKVLNSEPPLSEKLLTEILRHIALGGEHLSDDLTKFLATATNKTVPIINATLEALIDETGSR